MNLEHKIIDISEGTTKILVFKNKKSKKGPGTRKKVPFYNPSMEQNRDLSIVVCQWLIDNCKIRIRLLDGLAASGIRGIRLANELTGEFEIVINDWNSKAFDLIKKNAKKINKKNIVVENKDLNVLLHQEKFDYIDIDPFGSPVFYIDSALKSIKNNGIIACTATDTAALCGVYPKVCLRRYGAIPFHSIVMKEIGLRILLGYICREAGKYDKTIEPVLCYTTDHYFRVYIRFESSVSRTNEKINLIKLLNPQDRVGLDVVDRIIGPLWMGKLGNKKILSQIRSKIFDKKIGTTNQSWKLLDLLEDESEAPAFFYTSESLASNFKVSSPKLNHIFKSLKEKDFEVSKTHFIPTGFKTDAGLDEIEKMFKKG